MISARIFTRIIVVLLCEVEEFLYIKSSFGIDHLRLGAYSHPCSQTWLRTKMHPVSNLLQCSLLRLP